MRFSIYAKRVSVERNGDVTNFFQALPQEYRYIVRVDDGVVSMFNELALSHQTIEGEVIQIYVGSTGTVVIEVK